MFLIVVGGNQLSSGPIKVSKKDHVLRDNSLRKRYCLTVRLAACGTSGLLIHQAMTGKTNHNIMTGHTIARVFGNKIKRHIADRVAINGDIHMVRKELISCILGF